MNDSLNACVREVCEDMNLWPDDAFVLKVKVTDRAAACTMDESSGGWVGLFGWLASLYCGSKRIRVLFVLLAFVLIQRTDS